MIDLLGYIGAALLVCCGIPLLFRTRWGDSAFLLCWLFGEAAMLAYSLATRAQLPIVLNYGASFCLVLAIVAVRRGP